MTELILVRHGETDWNRELRFQGQVDVPLNAVGHEQALRIAHRLASEPAHHLYSSDLLRAQATAQSIATVRAASESARLNHLVEMGLREQNFGVVDGKSVDEIKLGHPRAWTSWLEFRQDHAFEGGESARQFHARVMATVQRLQVAHRGQTLIVVTHGGVLDMLYRTAHSLSLDGPRTCDIPNAGLNRLRLLDGGIEILSWADTVHLEGLPPQPVYNQLRMK